MLNSTFWRATLAVSLASLITFFNLYLVQPLLPMFRERYQLSTLEASGMLSYAMLGLALGLAVLASASDSFGRRKILLGSLWLSPLLTLVIAFAGELDFNYLLALRFAQGLVLAGIPAVAVAFLGELLEPPKLVKAVGIFIAANSIGGIGGRLISGWGAELMGSWQWAFVAIATLSLIVAALVHYLLPDEPPRERKPWRLLQSLSNYGLHLKRWPLLVAFAVGGGGFGIFTQQFNYLTFLLAEPPYELPSSWLSMLFLAYLAGTFTATQSGRLAQRWGMRRGISCGLLVMIGASLLSATGNLLLILAALALLSSGFFLTHSQASAYVNQRATQAKASASALYVMSYYLGAALGAFVIEPFYQRWAWLGVVGVSVVTLSALALVAFISLQEPARSKRSEQDKGLAAS